VTDILLLLILGAAAHQAAFLLTTAVIFEELRGWVAKRFGPTSKLTYLSHCHLCLSQWTAMLAAAVAVRRFDFTGVLVVDWALLSFTVAVVARFILEAWGLASSKVAEIRLRAAPPN